MESWLIWTSPRPGRRLHVTDVTNASRTLLMTCTRCPGRPAAGVLRHPGRHAAQITRPPRRTGVARDRAWHPDRRRVGDQQPRCSARCASGPARPSALRHRQLPADEHRDGAGQVKNGLLTTVGYQLGDEPAVYALEARSRSPAPCAVVPGQPGADHLGPGDRDLARTVDDNGGCYIVPAFSGLFARTGAARRAASSSG